MIPYGRQEIKQQDIDSVIEVLQSDFLTQGPVVPEFEKRLSKYCNVKHVLAVNSATSALHLSCLALDLGPGDTLWTSPISFVASSNCALYCSANVDFVDIDENSFNISTTKLEEKLELAKLTNSLPKVLVVVHMAGQPCDMRKIRALSQQFEFSIIEDASHAIGAKYQNNPVGQCNYSDITVFSFHPVKIITTGEGGAITTNSSKIAEKIELLRSHGITRNPELMTQEPDGQWYYQQIELGFNYRMTDIHAALGLSQLERLDEYTAKRNIISNTYKSRLDRKKFLHQTNQENTFSSYHLYILKMKSKIQRDTLFKKMRDADIGVNIHYIPIHLQPYYKNLGFFEGQFPNAEEYYSKAISIPIFPTMTAEQTDYVIDSLEKNTQ